MLRSLIDDVIKCVVLSDVTTSCLAASGSIAAGCDSTRAFLPAKNANLQYVSLSIYKVGQKVSPNCIINTSY